MSGLTVGVDVGGTKIAAGVVDEAGKLIASTRRETPATDTHLVLEAIADAVRELQQPPPDRRRRASARPASSTRAGRRSSSHRTSPGATRT